jgi:hypothetical protein
VKFFFKKVAQNVTISLGLFIFTKSHNGLPKSSQTGKKSPNMVTLNCRITQGGQGK